MGKLVHYGLAAESGVLCKTFDAIISELSGISLGQDSHELLSGAKVLGAFQLIERVRREGRVALEHLLTLAQASPEDDPSRYTVVKDTWSPGVISFLQLSVVGIQAEGVFGKLCEDGSNIVSKWSDFATVTTHRMNFETQVNFVVQSN